MEILDLGFLDFDTAHARMVERVEARIAGAAQDAVFLVEHPHVITLGRRDAASLIKIPEQELARLGVSVRRTERGGLVTYHGPGQLVAYPVVHLPSRGMGVRQHVGILEEATVAVAAAMGVEALCRPGYPGVWTVGGAKLASVGVAVRRGVTYHGIAFNVAPDLRFFDLIDPCGLGVRMTSLTHELGRTVSLDAVKDAWVRQWLWRLPGPRPA
jgi:lipoate-protein ligase B